ncbi:putative secreted protein [Labilithrix luteola]|uniref:Putative secreted protein n=1 Tax=Labilithrix luteola TaxID=1391654 RepID=A0A0K1QA27_9BACT|nr:SDR family oxidoreductase [Labilithrix luteola]AKV02250.1 putative secreted protein [Labilithrix luteola]
MKIVVIGGTGLIGTKLVRILRERGHDAIPASPASGVDTLTGEGLATVLAGADIVVDLSNSRSFEDKAVLEFFEKSGRNLLQAEATAGVKHHVALSVVGDDRLPNSGYMRAKIAQERLIRDSKIPYTIIRSTQFLEFLGGIIQSGTDGDVVRLSSGFMQPIASDDVALAVADFTLGKPVNGIIEIGGPERVRLSDIAQRYMTATHDSRNVVADANAPYFGTVFSDELVPGKGARLGSIGLEAWLARSNAA